MKTNPKPYTNEESLKLVGDVAEIVKFGYHTGDMSRLYNSKTIMFETLDEYKKKYGEINCQILKGSVEQLIQQNPNLSNENKADLYFSRAKICALTGFNENELDQIRFDLNKADSLSNNEHFKRFVEGQRSATSFIQMTKDCREMATYFLETIRDCCPGLFGDGVQNPQGQGLANRDRGNQL